MKDSIKCSKCDYVAKSTIGLSIHDFRKHTKRGQELAKAAAANMNSPASRKKSLAKRRATFEEKRRIIEAGGVPQPKRRPWGSNRRVTPTRRPWGSNRRLQHAATTTHQVRFCPNCACNLEAVRVAMSFAAGNR